MSNANWSTKWHHTIVALCRRKGAEAGHKRREERHIGAVERAKQAFLRDQIRLEREQMKTLLGPPFWPQITTAGTSVHLKRQVA